MNPVITLTPADCRLAEFIAKARYKNARDNGVINAKIGGQSNKKTDTNGMAGELAVCRLFNCYPDTTITAVDKLPKFDLVYRGIRIDAKTTDLLTGSLLATLKSRPTDCDAYVLAIGEMPEFEIVGWATSKELIQEKNIRDLGHGPGYCLKQLPLHDIHRLIKLQGPPPKPAELAPPVRNFQEVFDVIRQ